MSNQRVSYTRTGECNPDKCGAACCRNLHNPSELTQELFNPKDGVCQYLDKKTNRCKIYKDRPEWCRIFPSVDCPHHQNYLKVKDVCSYKFIEKNEIIKDEE